jgi:putative CocE/NonD family hydrolase
MFKKIALIVGAVVVAAGIGFVIWVASYPEINREKTPSGLPRFQSQYLTMRDGVDIAFDVWLPPDLAAGEQVPTLINATRYSRGYFNQDFNFAAKMRIRLAGYDPELVQISELDPEVAAANEAGYAVIYVDARGSAASFGTRPIEWSPDEIADYGEIMDWIVEQEWSNGNIGAFGTSYPGNTADMMAILGHPAFKATAPRYDDFDPLLGVGMPGGLRADGFLRDWSEFNSLCDHDISLSRPVEADTGGKLLEQAIAGHDNPNIYEAMTAIEYRSDAYGDGEYNFADASPYNYQEEFEAYDVPMQIWVSWLDAGTMDGALSRYLTFDTPQQVFIGPWSHGGSISVDPFLPDIVEGDLEEQLASLDVSVAQMNDDVLPFFDCYLKEDSCPALESVINYYTLNTGGWRTTTVWPPEGIETQRLYFSADNTLVAEAPAEAAVDEYTVDFTATTGLRNRWYAQMGTAIDYTADRAAEDEKLLTYTSQPMPVDVEITGSPIITLYLASTTEDCAFHVYLEDVAPDGRVTYITEGLLRAIHHQVSDAEPPFEELGSYHSFEREDAAPLVPGEMTEITFNLYATSVRIEAGHSLRIAIAGADADTFDRYPAEETPVWTVQYGGESASYIDLPMQEY